MDYKIASAAVRGIEKSGGYLAACALMLGVAALLADNFHPAGAGDDQFIPVLLQRAQALVG